MITLTAVVILSGVKENDILVSFMMESICSKIPLLSGMRLKSVLLSVQKETLGEFPFLFPVVNTKSTGFFSKQYDLDELLVGYFLGSHFNMPQPALFFCQPLSLLLVSHFFLLFRAFTWNTDLFDYC